MERSQICAIAGGILAVIGVVLAGIGTTRMELFIVYIAMIFAGAALMSVAKKLRDQR